jgi:hypothetical protein
LESGAFLAKKTTLLPKGKNSLKKVEIRIIEKRKIEKKYSTYCVPINVFFSNLVM